MSIEGRMGARLVGASAATVAAARWMRALAIAALVCGVGCSSADDPGAVPTPTPGTADPPIKVDQVGYLPNAPKLAMVTSAAATGAFSVRRADDGVAVFDGMLSAPARDADSGDDVRIADFSSLGEEGRFVLDVAGVGESFGFSVRDDVYRRAFYLAMRAFYGQRCGTAVDLRPTFAGYRHRLCHGLGTPNPDALFHPSSGRSGQVDAGRGWHDAGDYGKYVVSSGITTGELLWTYERFARRVRAIRLDLPESGDGTPDILDEIRWNLEWMLTMQAEDGGVYHKLTSEQFGGFVMPEVDNGGPRYVIGTGGNPYKSSCATADLAAVMAIAARVYEPFDGAFARRALEAARRAWDWVEAHPNVVFRNCCGVVTGEYGDDDCSDELLWAAAELFRTTGDGAYDAFFLSRYARRSPTVRVDSPQGWSDVRNLAMLTYYLAGEGRAEAGARARIRQDTVATADAVVARTGSHPYRISLTADQYVWGSNGVAANYGVALLLAHAIQPKDVYRAAALENLHYLLGRNTFSLSWVTQLGDNPYRHPHHRPSGADDQAEPWPGMLSGGPNRYGGDSVIDALPASPPARRYADHEGSYASNEIAINWNAPLVFVLAATLPE